jgi:Fe-S-cluster containining protein
MRTLPVVSNRARICLSCREKTCCSYYTVTVTAYDLLRIARAMQLAPADFLTYQRAADGDRSGFLLQPDGVRQAMALLKKQGSDHASSPCVFLLRTNDQHGLCALGDLRPAQCRTFPSYLAKDSVAISHQPAGCVRTWSYGDVDVDEERRELMRACDEEAAHAELVEQWNARVRADGRERPFEEFCAFVINHVRELEGVR